MSFCNAYFVGPNQQQEKKEIISENCPNCGGNIDFSHLNKIKCNWCSSVLKKQSNEVSSLISAIEMMGELSKQTGISL